MTLVISTVTPSPLLSLPDFFVFWDKVFLYSWGCFWTDTFLPLPLKLIFLYVCSRVCSACVCRYIVACILKANLRCYYWSATHHILRQGLLLVWNLLSRLGWSGNPVSASPVAGLQWSIYLNKTNKQRKKTKSKLNANMSTWMTPFKSSDLEPLYANLFHDLLTRDVCPQQAILKLTILNRLVCVSSSVCIWWPLARAEQNKPSKDTGRAHS